MTADPAPESVPGARTSIVIATRDRCAEVLRTVEELRSNHPRSPIIVVDNASEDGTPARLAEHFPEITVIRLRRNRAAPARNVGVRAATTPFIAFSDDDSWWDAGALGEAESLFDRHESIGLIAARTFVEPAGRLDPIVHRMASSPLGTRAHLPGPSVLGFTACAAVVRRTAFEQVRGFNTTLFFVGEEKLLAYDMAGHGWDLVHVGGITARHRPSPHRHDDRRARLERRNRLLTAWMRRPWPVALTETARLLRDSRTNAHARRALLEAARRAPAALRQRAVLPRSVEEQVRLVEQLDTP